MGELSAQTFREIMSHESFEFVLGEPLTKPLFFFGDAIRENDNFMFEGEERWLRTIGDTSIFLPGMRRSYGLAYFQYGSVP